MTLALLIYAAVGLPVAVLTEVLAERAGGRSPPEATVVGLVLSRSLGWPLMFVGVLIQLHRRAGESP